MNIQTLPSLTLSLLVLMLALHTLVVEPAVLWFGAAEATGGQAWRLLTGHLVHADWNHLFWNALGLGVLGVLIERHSRNLLWAALAAGVFAVDLLLLMPFTRLDYYCGLSGVLNALLVVALWLEWRASRSILVVVVTFACLAKVIVEISLGQSVISHISWPPFALSHLAGMAGGVACLVAVTCWHVSTRAVIAHLPRISHRAREHARRIHPET